MGKINKIWGLEEMEKRVENLRKLKAVGNNIDIYLRHYMSVADDRLDALYLTYHHVRGAVLKYDRETFGELNDVEYKPRLIVENNIWQQYQYIPTSYDYGCYGTYANTITTTTTISSPSATTATYTGGWYMDYIGSHNEVIQGFIDYGNTVEE